MYFLIPFQSQVLQKKKKEINWRAIEDIAKNVRREPAARGCKL